MRVRFTPQAWVNDYAVDIDLDGPDEWDTTILPDALADYRDKQDALRYETWFQDDPDCPQWIKDHRGPFYIEALCDRHGGPWGDDETCPQCTTDTGDVRPTHSFTTIN